MSSRTRQLSSVTAALGLALFAYVVVANAWLSEDVWITLRTVDNFVRGYGLTWNASERVQVYTHPLWALLLSIPYGIFMEGYFTTVAVSLALSFAVIVLAWRAWRREPWRVLALGALFVSSKAFVDYSTSGLENPLTHLFAALFFLRLFAKERDARPEKSLGWFIAVASLAYVNRSDTILAYAPALLWLSWRARRDGKWRLARTWLLGTLPASAWTLFAVVYYGFPVPNTAFAKLAGGHYHAPFFHRHSLAYFANSLRWDPMTLPVIAAGVLVGATFALRRRSGALGSVVAGISLLLIYSVRIGGDYMSGRLFALPFLAATLLLVSVLPDRVLVGSAAVVFVTSLFGPRTPTLRRFEPSFMDRDPTAIIDDHALHEHAALREVVRRKDYTIGRARQFEFHARSHGIVWGATGYHGFQNGPMLRTIDNLALSDALLARLPTRDPDRLWGRGHLVRDVPEGYIASVEMAENRIADPSLHAYYDKLLVIITGPLFTLERAKTIWEMNTGKYAHLVTEYEERRHARR